MHSPNRGPLARWLRAGLAVLLAFATTFVVLPGAERAEAAVVRGFTKLYSEQTNGSIVITGNRVLTCPASTNCTNALAGTVAASNNNFAMTQLDLDGIAGTANSSSANIAIPTGARVLYAGLFWGAARTAGTSGTAATGTANQIKFRAPGATAYTTLTADTIDSSGLATNDYSAYRNVTALVQAGGSGTYWGADVSAATGEDRYGAWSLVVALGDPTAPLRDLTVSNGYATLTSTETVTTTLSGFLTPAAGTVNAKFGSVVYEGDAGITGDYMTVGSARLADLESPSANFFGSRITAGGANLTNRNPASVNNLGIDAKVIDAPGVVPNGATSTNVTFSTSGDYYYPAALTTQIDLYTPTVTGSKTVTNLNGNTPAKARDTLEYTMSFGNSGDDGATGSVVEDSLPAGTTYVPGSLSIVSGAGAGAKTDAAGDDQAEYVAASRLVRYRVGTGANATAGGTLAKGATTTVRFRVTIDTAAAGTALSNSGNLLYTAETLGTRYTYQTADVSTPVSTLADLSLTKTGSPAAVSAGNTITYTLRAANAGPTAAADVAIADTLPTGTTLVSSTPSQGTCSISRSLLTCALGTVANGAAATVSVVVRVPADSTSTAVTNVAEVTSSTSDPTPANNRATVTTPVSASADLALTKTASTGTPVPGSTVTYTLVTTNNGPSVAANVVVTDALPAQFSGLVATTTAGTCDVNGNGVSCAVASLAPGASVTVRVTATLDSTVTTGALTNRAQVQSDTPDPTSANNSAAVTLTPAAAQADVQVSKTTVTSPVVAGQPIQYRINVTNAGPSAARGISVVDAGPAALVGVTASPSIGTCTVAGTTLTCAIDILASGATATITVNATVLSTTTGTLTNSATATSTTADPVPGNNTGTTSDPVTTRADLDLSKTASPNPVVDGQNVTYTMNVRNIGPSVARSVVLTDPVPAPLGFVSATSTAGTCSQAGGTVTCALGDLALGATATVTVVASVPPTGGANGLVNTATVTSPTTDPVAANNSASYALTTSASANIVMTKTAAPQPVVSGNQLTFTLTARNAGPSAATGVTITDTLPSSVAAVSATTSTPGGTCAIAGQVVTCSVPTLANGASLVATVVGTVAAGTPASNLVNSASASSQGPPDPTLSDNTATSTTRVQTRADLVLDKSGPATVTAGNTLTWSIDLRNDGPSVADSVVVQDALPAGVTFVSGTGAGGITCALQSGPQPNVVTCDLGTLGSGATRTITLVGRVDSDTASGAVLTNSATVSSSTTDPTPANNTDTQATTVATAADVSLTKSVSPSPIVAGAPATYSVSATNAGPSTAQAVTISDTIPAGLTIRSASVAGGTCTVTGQVVSCTVPALAAGAVADTVVQVTASAALAGSVTNTATVTTTTSDPVPGNNTVQLTTPVSRVADLQLIKTADQRTVTAGTGLTYTLTVVNNGPSTATAASVTDTLPAGFTYVGSTTSAGTCSAAGQVFSCALGDVAPGTAVSVTVTVRVSPATAAGAVVNTASVTSGTPDPAPADNTGSVSVDVDTSADLSLTKNASSETFVPGTPVAYTVTVTNSGPSVARVVTVADTVPAGITGVTATWGPAATPCTVTGQDVSCAIGSLASGQVVISITGTLGSQFEGTSITNTATVTSTTPDPDTADRTATVTSKVVGQADLALVKTMEPANPVAGQQVVFTLTATNNGPSAALNPQFIDQLPAGLTGVSVVPPPGATGCDIVPPVNPGTVDNPNAPTVICSGPIFRAGITVVGTITATVAPGFTGLLSNTGRTSSDTIDPVAANNESTASGIVRTSADLSITKSLSPAAPVPGRPVTYTLNVRNAGPSTATGVTVADSVPTALTGVSASSGAGSCTVGAENAVSCGLGSLAPNAGTTVTVTGTLRPDFTGSLANTASVSSPTPDPDPTNNSATASGVAAPSADVGIVKRMSPASPVPGQPVTFSLTVTNAGPSTAAGVTVADDLDRAFAGVGATTTTGTCTVNAGNAVACQLGSLAPGSTETVTVTGTLATGFTGRLDNTATVASPTPDPVAANNTSSVSGQSAPSAGIVVTKTMSPAAPIPGSAITYTVGVRNTGPSTATAVVVTDQLAAAISAVTATADNGTSCSVSAGNLLTCPLGAVEPGGAVSVTITGTLASAFTGVLTNTARATTTTPDPNPADNTATVSGTARPSADVSVAKRMLPAVPVPGRPITFTIDVANAGPSTATGVVVSDQLDPALLGATATTTAGTCSVSAGNVLTCPLGSLAPDADATVSVRATLAPSFTGTLTNTATVSSPTADPVTDNNSSTVTGDGAPSADLAITKSMDPVLPVPGQTVTFRLAVTNAGPSAAVDVNVADQLNTALSGLTTTSTTGSCTIDAGNALACALGTLAPAGSATVTVTGTLASAYRGSLSNTASVASTTPDPSTADNTATVSGQASPVADLVVGKTMTPAAPVPGQQVTFTVTVRNDGPSTATGTSLTDPVARVLTGVTATTTVGTCTVGGDNVVDCLPGTLAPGATATVTVRGTLSPGFTGTLTNTATADTSTPDPDASNDSATVSGVAAPSADLRLAKTMSPTAPIPGSAVSYSVVVTNAGPSSAFGAVVTDPLAPAISAVTATVDDGSTCSLGADNLLTCPVGTIAPGASVTVSITGTLAPTFTGDLVNTARVASQTPDPEPADNSATVTGTAAPSADLVVSKSLSPTAPVPGRPVTWTIGVRNTGPSTATGVTISDELPAAVSGAAARTTAGTCTVSSAGVLSCLVDSLAPDGVVTVTVTALLDPAFTGALTNTATATADTDDPTPADNTASASGTAAASADVSVTKSMSPARPVPGQQVTWVLSVRNAGPSRASDVTVADVVAPDLTGVAATSSVGSCTVDGANLAQCSLGDLAVGGSATVTITGVLDPAFTGALDNTATVSSPTSDPDPGDNTSSTTGTAAPSADVSVTKTMSPADPVAGDTVTFTMTVRNAGPSSATGVRLADVLDPALGSPTTTTTAGTCEIVDGTLGCALGTLPPTPGTPVVVTVTATLDQAFTGTLANTATVEATTPDPVTANNSATASGDSTASADLSMTKTMSPLAPIPGAAVSFTLTTRNDGPSTATGVVVSDRLDPAISAVTATADDGSTCAVDGGVLTCPLAPMASGAEVTVSVTGDLDPAFTGQLTNTGTVTASTPDLDPSNNSDTVTGVAAPSADVFVTKTLSPVPPVPGRPVTYTITVGNDGPSTAQAVTVADQVSPDITGAVASSTAGTCSVDATNGVTCDLGALDPAASPTVTVTGTLSAAFTGTLSNSVTATSITPDPDLTNNRAGVDSQADPSADLSVGKTMTPAAPVPGEAVTFTLAVHNDGPSTAVAATLTDRLDPALLGAAVRTTVGSCAIDDRTLRCSLGSIAPDGDAIVVVTAVLDPAFTGTLTNTAQVASATTDPDPTDNSSTVSGVAQPRVDLSVEKVLNPVAPVPGEEVTFTMTVLNDGPSTAVAATLTDPLAASLSGVRATTTTGTCAVGADDVVRCAFGDLAPGATAVVQVVAGVDPGATGSLTNTATVDSTTEDADPGNNSSTVTATLGPIADLSIDKSMSPASPIPGSAVTFTLAVDDQGPSTATGVVVTDQLDPALSQVTATADNGGTCVVDGDNLLTCQLGAIAPADGVVTVTVTATLAASFTGTLTNTARVASQVQDPDPTDDSDTVSGGAAPSADVSVSKTITSGAPVAGRPVTFSMVVANDGPSTARDVVLADVLDPALTGARATTTAGTCTIVTGTLDCDLGDLAPGGTPVTVTVTAVLDAAFSGALANTARVTTSTTDPVIANNVDTISAGSGRSADLSIDKALSPAAPVAGGTVTYTLTVTNAGPSSATAVVVDDVLPEGLSAITATVPGGTCDPVGADRALVCRLGGLGVRGTAVVTVTAALDPDFTGTLENTATVTSATPDPVLDNNSDTVVGQVSPAADLSVTKQSNALTAVAGGQVTWTIVVRNDGPATATAVTLADPLPEGIDSARVTTSAGACDPVGADRALSCALGAMAPGAVVTVTVVAAVSADATGSLSNTARVASPTPDPDTDDRSSTSVVDLVADTDLAVTKTASTRSAEVDDEVTYTLRVTASGPSTATGVTVTDDLPAGLAVVGTPSSDTGSCSVVGSTVSCALGTMRAGDVAVITLVARVTEEAAGRTVTNTAGVASTCGDSAPSSYGRNAAVGAAAVCGDRDPTNDSSSAAVAVADPPVPPPPPLAYTGAQVLLGGLLAIGLLALGILLVVASRRRHGLAGSR